MTKNENSPRIIFVEGKDDESVVWHIINRSNLGELEIHVAKKEGVNALLEALPVEPKRSGRLAVGFVLDANDHPDERWKSITDRFGKEGISFPNSLCPNGTIVEASPEKRLARIG